LGGTTVGKAVFKAANAAAAQQAMDTEVGVDVQAYDAGLTDIAGLAVTDGNIIVGDGTNWVAENGATARTSLGLGSIATQASSSVTITGGSITGITDLAVADGGTGQGSYTDGELLIGNTTGNTLTKATLTAGTGISVTNGSGAITIASTAGGGFSNMEVFTSPGTWTNPGTVEKVKVTVVGGGGNGGSANSAGTYGAGGGGGGTAIEIIPFPSGTNVPVTVGGPGATSSFGAYTSATGGAAGATSSGASGGVGSGGQVNIEGSGAGGRNPGTGGFGGSSTLGGGGITVSSPPGSPNALVANGDPGGNYGGGGGGAFRYPAAPGGASPGGTGAPGVVIVEY
jgi:hypothetical protein